jgi:hypothetical protein
MNQPVFTVPFYFNVFRGIDTSGPGIQNVKR